MEKAKSDLSMMLRETEVSEEDVIDLVSKQSTLTRSVLASKIFELSEEKKSMEIRLLRLEESMERLKVAPNSEEKASSSYSSSSILVLPPLSPSLSSSEKEKFSLPRPLIKTEVLAPMSIPHQPTFRKIHFQPMLFKGDSTDNLSDYKVNVDTFLNFASFASEEEKLSIVLSKFSPFALSWFDHLLVKPQTVGNLLKRVLSDFGQQVQESAYSRLASRKQQKGESVHVFYEAMSTLIGQVPGHLSEEQRLFYFVEGLLPGIKSELQKLKNLLSETGVVFDLPMAKRTAQKIEYPKRLSTSLRFWNRKAGMMN